ncbi:NAD(P)-binding protein, partial [Ascobolus immersus RN42]
NEVLVRINTVGLNYRDIFMASAKFPVPNPPPLVQKFGALAKIKDAPLIPCSDACATVFAVGDAVTEFEPGQRVITQLAPDYLKDTDLSPTTLGTGLGGSSDGVLREFAVLPASALVPAPSNLTDEEAATISCAGITAWNALFGLAGTRSGLAVKKDDWVLIQGTGGVATWGIVLAQAVGAHVVVTTSSAVKEKWLLEELKVDGVVNYVQDTAWGTSAKAMTPDARGFDHILELGGPGTMRQSMDCIAVNGVVSIVGMLGGLEGESVSFLEALVRGCVVRGVYAGSRDMSFDMVRFIEEKTVKPVVDGVFELEKAREAFEFVAAGGHRGNVVIR